LDNSEYEIGVRAFGNSAIPNAGGPLKSSGNNDEFIDEESSDMGIT
jgi:hypothetical protein